MPLLCLGKFYEGLQRSLNTLGDSHSFQGQGRDLVCMQGGFWEAVTNFGFRVVGFRVRI